MSTGELVAWQAGTDWARAGLPAALAENATDDELTRWLTATASNALTALGRGTFAYWFWRGYDDATTGVGA